MHSFCVLEKKKWLTEVFVCQDILYIYEMSPVLEHEMETDSDWS